MGSAVLIDPQVSRFFVRLRESNMKNETYFWWVFTFYTYNPYVISACVLWDLDSRSQRKLLQESIVLCICVQWRVETLATCAFNELANSLSIYLSVNISIYLHCVYIKPVFCFQLFINFFKCLASYLWLSHCFMPFYSNQQVVYM